MFLPSPNATLQGENYSISVLGTLQMIQMFQMSKKSKLSSATTEGCSLNKLIRSSKLRNLTLRNIWYFVSVCSTSLLLQESYRKQVSVNSSKSEPVFAAFFRSKFFQLPLPLAPLLPSQKHHFSFAAGKGVLTVSYGRRWRKWEEKMVSLRGRVGVGKVGGWEGGWEWVDFVPRKVLPEAMLAERSLVDEHFFPNTLRLLGAFIIIFMGAIIIIMFMSPPF